MQIKEKVLSAGSIDELIESLKIGLNFKDQNRVRQLTASSEQLWDMIATDLPENGLSLPEINQLFLEQIVPHCTNFGSTKFMGFPDAGSSTAATAGAVISDFFQQNLINQSVCAPAATFVEMAVLRWLRTELGYPNGELKNAQSIGGIVTLSGTHSNTIAMMLARERSQPGALQEGISNPANLKIVVPEGIGHYSIRSAQQWLGIGRQLLEVPTKEFRYDLSELEKTLSDNKGKIMSVVAYAGDSRTMTVDNLRCVAEITKKIDGSVWLHADACHGFSFAFSKALREKIAGIHLFDSISTDPHKTLLIPYGMSALLVKDPDTLQSILTPSDLIMKEDFAFGQLTPFIGTKPWASLKLWYMMMNFGRKGLEELVTDRHMKARLFEDLVKQNHWLKLVCPANSNAVVFQFHPEGHPQETINALNQKIYERLLEEGEYHLHQFPLAINETAATKEIIYPLRFMSGNPNIAREDLQSILQEVTRIGREELAATS